MICFDPKTETFHLQTENTSYVMGVYRGKYLLHLYWGKKLTHLKSAKDMLIIIDRAFSPTNYDQEWGVSSDTLPMEYPTYGNPDMRSPAFHAFYEDGSHITELCYQSYRIFDGKPHLAGLPATYTEQDSEAQTLQITLADSLTGLQVYLTYTVFKGSDAIAKSVRVDNKGTQTVKLGRVLSSCFDFQEKDYELLHLHGAWARERHIQKLPLGNCLQMVDSKRGASSHMHNPFFALARKESRSSSFSRS